MSEWFYDTALQKQIAADTKGSTARGVTYFTVLLLQTSFHAYYYSLGIGTDSNGLGVIFISSQCTIFVCHSEGLVHPHQSLG